MTALGYSRQAEAVVEEAAPAAAASPIETALASVLQRFDKAQNLLQAAEADRQEAQVKAARLEAELEAERRRAADLESRLEEASRRWWKRKPKPTTEAPSDKPA